MMGYKIAFDPSVNHIGCCSFKDGQVYDARTIHRSTTQGNSELYQYPWVKSAVRHYFDSIRKDLADPIEVVCVEEFVKGYHINSRQRKCDGARAVIIAIAWDYAIEVITLGKGTKKGSKEQAQTLAERAGLKCDEHAADAYYIGLLAGFDR